MITSSVSNALYSVSGAFIPLWRFTEAKMPQVPIFVATVTATYKNSYYYRMLIY